MHHERGESYREKESLLHQLDARVKLVGLLCYLVLLAWLEPPWFGVLAALAIGVILASYLPLAIFARAGIVLPFALVLAASAWMAGSEERVPALLTRAYLSALAVTIVVSLTPPAKLFRALAQLGVPSFLVEVIQSIYRYLFVLRAKAHSMRMAIAARGGTPSMSIASGAVAVLFGSSYEKAEAIYRAMLSRGHGAGGQILKPAAAAPLVEVRDLRFRYPDGTLALRGVDFGLEKGETVILLGANGSGKTTFSLHLNGLLRGQGEVRIAGLDTTPGNLRAIRRKVGMVFQNADEQLFLPTVLEDVAYGPLQAGMTAQQAEERAHACLNEVDLPHLAQKAPYHLSAGERRRAAIAGVLATDPEILVLDEPTTYLDPPAQRHLVQLLRRLPQAKVIATHDLAFARAIGTRAVFFQEGKIVGAGTVEELIGQFDWQTR